MNIQKALREAIEQCDLPQRDKRKLRIAMLFPRFMQRIEPEIQAMLEEEYKATGVQAIDWATILKFFIENILPLLLNLLDN